MAATWRLNFFRFFFLRISLKPGIDFRGLRVYWHCPFSCEIENEAMAAILVLSILINPSYFQLNAFQPAIYRFLGSASKSIGIVRFHVRSKLRI